MTTSGTESMYASHNGVTMFVAAGPLVTIATPGRPVACAYPLAMWPAPCSWRTRMCRIELSMSGSYTGRMAPPGRPNMTSVPSISRLLMSAWAPVSFMWSSGGQGEAGKQKPLRLRRGKGARERVETVRLRDYYEEVEERDRGTEHRRRTYHMSIAAACGDA